ncbi:unnamed protein product [Linum trigynum]|uniref:Uncharacterized protein n=1 Tax=Linum trigynum TaxID=586398 RepID=A0AAV2CNG8_9ROSI
MVKSRKKQNREQNRGCLTVRIISLRVWGEKKKSPMSPSFRFSLCKLITSRNPFLSMGEYYWHNVLRISAQKLVLGGKAIGTICLNYDQVPYVLCQFSTW